MQSNREKSLEELEADYWPDYEFETDLIRRCHEFRRIPLNNLSTEQLRLLIGQNIGLNFLIPLALEKLKNNPLEYGDMYPGDLLNSVVNAEREQWAENFTLVNELKSIIYSLRIYLQNGLTNEEIDKETISGILKRFSSRF